MNGFQDWPMFWLGVVQTTLVVMSLLLLRRQIRQGTDAAKSEHERRCREATVQFFSEGFHRFYTEQIKLEKQLGVNFLPPLTTVMVDQILADADMRLAAHHMLSFLETLSTSVNHGVFDPSLTDKLLGGVIVESWSCFGPYIARFREMHNSSRYFDQFEQLALALAPAKLEMDTHPVHSTATSKKSL